MHMAFLQLVEADFASYEVMAFRTSMEQNLSTLAEISATTHPPHSILVTTNCWFWWMLACYVLAASGLHQACPGDPRFEIFTPLFDKVIMHFDPKYAKGMALVITAENKLEHSNDSYLRKRLVLA